MYRLWEEGWKERYYQSKYCVSCEDSEFIQQVVESYTEGLCWVMAYYYQVSWYLNRHVHLCVEVHRKCKCAMYISDNIMYTVMYMYMCVDVHVHVHCKCTCTCTLYVYMFMYIISSIIYMQYIILVKTYMYIHMYIVHVHVPIDFCTAWYSMCTCTYRCKSISIMHYLFLIL